MSAWSIDGDFGSIRVIPTLRTDALGRRIHEWEVRSEGRLIGTGEMLGSMDPTVIMSGRLMGCELISDLIAATNQPNLERSPVVAWAATHRDALADAAFRIETEKER